MKKLYLECNSGISGDMTVAALLDAGASEKELLKVLKTVPLEGFEIKISRVNKNGIDVCDFDVILKEDNHDHDMEYLFGHEHEHHGHEHEHHEHEHHEHEHHEHEHHGHKHHHEHRNLANVMEIINKTQMSDSSRDLACKIFRIIAEAESKAHNKSIEEVHFHEVGAVDSIVDVISMAVCFDNLGIKEVIIPKVYEGNGTVRCQHGILPIPVPAVSNIVEKYKIPLSIMNAKGEFITPTGAAFIAAVMTGTSLPEDFTILKLGMGGGKRTYQRPSILRCFVIESQEEEQESIYKLETNIDDCTGEVLGFVMEELLKNGAYDVHYVPCFMKKNRPAWILYVICSEEHISKMENIIFQNTSTIGIRRFKVARTKLERKALEIDSPFGKILVKQVVLPDGSVRNYPEYEVVAKIARENNISILEVMNKISLE